MLVCSMGTPGGGKSFITPRFQRHFNIVAFAQFDDNTMSTIFKSILSWYFRTGQFSQDVSGYIPKIVAATMVVYKKIQQDLKPTPMKTHYTFNLRDFSKVICGICMTTNKELQSSDSTLRLWAHECCRIFGDRLINNEDRMWMLNCIRDTTRAPFGQNFDTVFNHLDTDKNGKVETLDEFRGLLFGDIYTPFGIPERPYEEIMDKERLNKCANEALVQYNQMSDKPMPLVLFNFAIEHLLRIGRIIKQPGGHALLVGVGGSGRQSLTKLASRLADFDNYQIEIKKNYRMNEWREDIKELMRNLGQKGNPTAFIFTDNQIKEDGFLEDINNILNTGEVPNIFPADEKADCCELARGPAK
jgi:dynein heavy chain